MTEVSDALLELLVLAVPELDALLCAHRRYYDEVLPTVFLGEVADEVGSMEVALRDRLLKALEALIVAGNSDVRNYIATGFVEGLPQDLLTEQSFLAGIGPHLRAEVDYECGRTNPTDEANGS